MVRHQYTKSGINQSNTKIGPLPAMKVLSPLGDHDLKRRTHNALEEMATTDTAVLQAENGVKMKAGLAVIALRQIPEQAQDLALLGDGDNPICLGGEIEPADLGLRKKRRSRKSMHP
jgi:hypothetical protein